MGNENQRDMVLAPNEQAFILDQTKGHVTVYVGPNKISPSNTDMPCLFDEKTGRFYRVEQGDAIRVFPSADEGSYIVLHNPALGGKDHPEAGKGNTQPDMATGRKVNIPGPAAFPLWPGQTAVVVPGHILRSNQYLRCRVYNDTAAKDNWGKAVIKLRLAAKPKATSEGAEAPQRLDLPENVATGQILIIRGTEVSFFIPPTGLEVLQDASGAYVLDAVSLERTEYCVLIDENGNQRNVRGPDVVFPTATERFVESGGQRKFPAIELDENSGVFIKVVADYIEADGTNRTVGEEMFLTGKDVRLYFPREEHQIVRNGAGYVFRAVAVPNGEGKHVLDRQTGKVETVRGPKMLLPDPRHEELAPRMLSDGQCALWFPNRDQTALYNAKLRAAIAAGRIPDEMRRDERFAAAVPIDVWTGFAVQIVGKNGDRRVVAGPQTALLDYDQGLQVMALSTGKPKNTDMLLRTVYLQTNGNKVTDIVEAETADQVPVVVKVQYRVQFEGEDQTLWFNVDNYVKLICDHARSMLKGAIKRVGVEQFKKAATDIVRDTILGAKPTDGGHREGMFFAENSMRVYDVEVLDSTVKDAEIGALLRGAQVSVVKNALSLEQANLELNTLLEREKLNQRRAEAEAETASVRLTLQQKMEGESHSARMAQIEAERNTVEAELEATVAEQEARTKIADADLARRRALSEEEIRVKTALAGIEVERLEAETAATIERVKAVQPEMVAAMQSFADKDLAGKLAEHLSPYTILGGKSVTDVLRTALKGTVLERVVNGITGSPEVPPRRT